MYTDIYKKLKLLAKIVAIIGIIISIILALYCIIHGMIIGLGEELGLTLFLSGFFWGTLGVIFSWISTWVLYAFADMGENIHCIKEKYYGPNTNQDFTDDNYNSDFEEEVELKKPNYYL